MAQNRGCYDETCVQSIDEALSDTHDKYDLILAADVLVYIGDLSSCFRLVARSLKPGGLFAFSVEAADEPGRDPPPAGYQLHATRRFSHTLQYLRDLSGKSGLKECVARREVLRSEAGADVIGWIVVLRKSET